MGSRFEGTCLALIDSRLNDTVREWHYPAIGRPTDPSLDFVAQLRTWLPVAGLAVLASGLRQAGVAGGALPSMPPAVAAHEVRAGRRHVGHGRLLPSAGKRLVPLGRLAGGGRLQPLLWHLLAGGRHLYGHRGRQPAQAEFQNDDSH